MNNKKYGRPPSLRNPVTVNIILEKDRMDEYKQILKERGLNLSEGIRRMIETQLQKNVEGSDIPNLLPVTPTESDVNQWIQLVHNHKEDNIMLTRCVDVAKAVISTGNDYLRKNKRPYR